MDTDATPAGTREGSREPQPPPHPTRLLRWSGLAALLGGLLILQAPVLHPEETPEGFASPVWVTSHFALYVGYVMIQLGLVGILMRQLRRAGRLGVLGFAVAFVGVGFTLMEGRDHTFSLPILRLSGLQSDNPDALPGLWELLLNATLFSVGHILLGAATWRARVFPRAAAALMAVGAPVLAFSPPIPITAVALVGSALYGSAMVWIGYALLTVHTSAAPAESAAPREVLAGR
jgi:hypothetical protein